MNMFIDGIRQRLQEIFDPAQLGATFATGATNAIVGLAVLLVFYLGWRVLSAALRPLLRRSHLDETAVSFVETVVRLGMLTIGAISALNAAGIKTSAVLASLGLVGLTIGFAARDALSNIISGILIFLDRPFVIGDLIEIEGIYGKVTHITLRSTRVVTSDGRMLAVPNTEVINKTVVSYTNFPHLRLDVPITVAVTENLANARQILLGIVESDPDYLTDPAPRVVVKQLNDYNVMLELQAWIHDERQHVEKRYQLRERMFNALTAAGVVMPYEIIEVIAPSSPPAAA